MTDAGRTRGVTRDRVGDIDAGDEDGERIKCPPGQVVSTLWLTGGNGSVYITSVRIIGSGSGRELRIGMLNPSRFDAEGVVIKFRCKTAKRGVTLTVEKGGRSPRKAEVVQRHATLSRKLSGVRRDVKVAAATGTIQLRCFSHSNSVIEAGYVFRGSGTVLSSGPLPDGTGWRARVTGTKAGDVVGMHIICAQPGPLLRARWQG